MCYPPLGYIIFSLRKLKFYGGRGPDMRAGDQGPDNPNTRSFVVRKQLTYCLSEAVTRKSLT